MNETQVKNVLSNRLLLEDVTIAYGRRSVINNASVRFECGIATGLIGQNGAGKTTLLKGMCGAVELDSGSIGLGTDTAGTDNASWKRRIALIPDDNALFQDLTVTEHFDLIRILYGIDASAPSRVERLCSLFGLDEYREEQAAGLSFGYRKRLAIALALFRNADVFLFDEPFTGLDVGSLELFNAVIRIIAGYGKIVVIASHLLSRLEDLCDTIYRIRDGAIEAYTAEDPEESEIDSLLQETNEHESPVHGLSWLDSTDF